MHGTLPLLHKHLRAVILAIIAASYAFFALYWGTDGFRGITSETVRKLRIAEHPAQTPNTVLVDQAGQHFTLGSAPGRPVLIIDFVYTQCETVCSAMGSRFQQLQDEILHAGLSGKIRLLTISFDPDHDTPQVIQRYAARMRADPNTWQIATVADPSTLPELLKVFGIRVIPAPLGNFEHNAAFHVVDSNGRLIQIHGIDEANSRLLHDAMKAIWKNT
ncbi:SCO family protein [Burkholderia sp. Bp9126]|nr:SCO family protein [Burkholderia sp. Bp9126]